MIGELRQPERRRMPDQLSENAVPTGQGSDPLALLGVDADREELREPVLVADHSQRAVPGVHQLDSSLHDSTQYLGEVQFPPDRENCLEQTVQAVPRSAYGTDTDLQLAEKLVQREPREALGTRRMLFAHRDTIPSGPVGAYLSR